MALPTLAYHKRGLVSITSSGAGAILDLGQRSQLCFRLLETCRLMLRIKQDSVNASAPIRSSPVCKAERCSNGNLIKPLAYRLRSSLLASKTPDEGEPSRPRTCRQRSGPHLPVDGR